MVCAHTLFGFWRSRVVLRSPLFLHINHDRPGSRGDRFLSQVQLGWVLLWLE
ncbi:hypothetical protein [Stenomitos frigidus]|uniref:hypothetical protein n=1 Tax=Stenomitos frigidus TaxID=1886765 RepID=UPI0015E65669|nr:hypothetical protein [Stenomitos frigidus]